LGKRVHDVYFHFFDPPISILDNQINNFQIEHRFKKPSNEVVWISSHVTTLTREGNPDVPIGYMNVARDITPRRVEQETLIKSQRFI
jgi:hypothetical protein